jgi:hypothetical protein
MPRGKDYIAQITIIPRKRKQHKAKGLAEILPDTHFSASAPKIVPRGTIRVLECST